MANKIFNIGNLICEKGCKLCDIGGNCTKCVQSMYLNSKKCYFCPDGQYFNPSLNSCQDCGASCSGMCNYRLECFQCNGTQLFSLLQMKCVDSCSTDEIVIESANLHGLKVCRSLNYYVYPSSESILELGTFENPYKSINDVIIEMFNFADISNKNVSVKLSLGDSHYLSFGKYGLINILNSVFEPYNEASVSSDNAGYDVKQRSTIVFKDYDISLINPTTRFNLISDFTLNETIILSFSSDIQLLMNQPQIGLVVMDAAVTFQNIRMEDDYKYISHQKAIWFVPTKLESKVFNMINFDVKCTSTIMKCSDSISLKVQNMNVIDYINIGAGFNFLTQCNYDGATTVGEILFDRVFFTKESADTYIFKVGSFIEICSPFNITIQNSEFSLNNYIKESFDAIMIRDTGDCTLTDDVVQNIIFTNNTLTLDNTTHDSSINLKISYSNSNKRFKNVIVTDNIFFNIIGAEKSLLEVEYYSKGTVVLTNNTFRNCSTVNDFLVVNAIDSIVMSQTTFDSCTAKLDGYISAGTAKNITINGLVLTNSSKNSDLKPTSLVKLSTENEGNLILNNLNFYQNSVKVSILEIDESIGALIFQNSQFNGEVVTSATPYINIFNIFKLQFSNLTFSNIKSDTSSAIKPLLVYIKNVEIDKEGDFIIESVKVSNSTIGFLNIYGISGSDSSVKTVTIQDINVTNSLIYSQSDLMSIGPILTGAKLSFVMKKISFTNLNFASIVNMIHINVQSGVPFLIENCSFVNNIRGRIMLDPASTSTTVNRVHLNINNITVADNDFSTSTMFVLNEYCELHVSDCIMKRNSGYIYGTIASITGKNSTAAFTNCSFNNNNGANGGVFYVTTRINAAVAYIENLGTLAIDNCTISFNIAILTGIIQVTDTVDPVLISNSQIYKNTIVTYNATLTEINNPNVCINLCFASEGYIKYLSENKNVLIGKITYTLFDMISSSLSISNTSFTDMDSISICNSYNGEINILNSNFVNLKLKSSFIFTVYTNVTIINVLFDSISQYSNFVVRLFDIHAYSNLMVTKSNIQNIGIQTVYSEVSPFTVNEVNIYNSSCLRSTIEAISSTGIVLKNVNISESISTNMTAFITFTSCVIDEISNSNFTEIQYYVIEFIQSNLTKFQNNYMNGINKGLYFLDGSNGMILNSTFANFVQNVKSGDIYKSQIKGDGSAINIKKSNVIIDSSTFMNNTAIDGGAVLINCFYLYSCANSIINSYFYNNTALHNGGAINYNSFQPNLTNNMFESNSALFRPNIANYPLKLMMVDDKGNLANLSRIDGLQSGLAIENSFKIAIVNNEEQIMTNQNENAVRILAIDSDTKVKGQTTVVPKNGVATFSYTVFIGIPGKASVKYILRTKAIDYNSLEYVNPEFSTEQILTVSFRWCKPGEYQSGNVCVKCGIGSYSVVWNETKCHNCPNNAACEGEVINLNSGYWRIDANSTDIMECPNSNACLGGYNNQSIYPVYCAAGYGGLLCDECIENNKEKYERTSDNQCSKCPDPILNLFRIIGFGALVFAYLIIMMLVNIQK